MKACQNVIVTLTIGDEQLDVELPAFLPVAEVNARVLEMLRALYPPGLRQLYCDPPVRPGSAHCGVQNACVLRDLGRRKPAGLRYIGVICCF